MTEVIKYDLALPVKLRKHEVDTKKLVAVLREAKQNSKKTNRQIAEKLGRPMTEVEHWFRTDNCFSIPDASLWYSLKELININTVEFDLPVTEFIEQPGIFEKANRFYDVNGLAPTITAASADEKIIFDEGDVCLGEGFQNKQEKAVQPIEKKPFTYVELFAGIGGFRQALDRLGGNCVFASEIDKYAQQAYRALYGDEAHLHGDITKISEEDVPNHDVLVGGMPCQAFSLAGKRLGFEDTRGTLFFEIARIAKLKQPKVILIENVKGLVNHDKGKTLNVMIHALNEIGFTVDFSILNSKFFNVPQSRERIIITAIRNDLVTQEDWNVEGSNIEAKGKIRLKEQGVRSFNFDWPEQNEVTTRLRDILEKNVDQKYYLDEEKVSKLLQQLNEKELKGETKPQDFSPINNEKPTILDVSQMRRVDGEIRVYTDVSPTLAARDYKEPRLVAQYEEPQIKKVGNVHPSGNGMNGNVYDVDAGLSPTLTTNKSEGVKFLNVEPINGEEIEDVRSCSTRTRAYIGKPEALEIRKDEVSNTITSVAKDAYVFETPRYRIRKLIPLETWRLQGFSDESFYIVKNAGVSDSQLYKQSGNAVTVNVVESVGKNLLKYL